MSTVLCLSSQVARGFVGGSANRIALQSRGHDCWLLPTVVLSNHPGHERFAGEQVPVGRMRAMVEAMQANGWLEDVDAIITGYMPSEEHVAYCAQTVEMVKKANPDCLYLCDPIMGDDPGGLYLDDGIAAAIRDQLIPLADIATPNRFEMEWLAGRGAKRVSTALPLMKALGPKTVLTSSLTGEDPQELVNLLLSNKSVCLTVTDRRKHAPHGVGDLLAGIYLAELLSGHDPDKALSTAVSSVEEALESSAKADELLLVTKPSWREAEGWPVETCDQE